MRSGLLNIALASAAILAGCGSDSPRSELERAASTDYPAQFAFVDRPDGASLMECLGAAETLQVTVDRDQTLMAVRREGETAPAVIWTPAASFVDASLLTAASGWVRIDRNVLEPTRTDIEAAVGPSLSGYVFATGIPPDPVAVARSVLAAASEFTEVESSSGELTVSVLLDPSVAEMPGLDLGALPDLRFSLVDGRIVAISAHLPSDDGDSFGFVWDYHDTTSMPTITTPQTSTSLEDLANPIGTGSRGPVDCTLGS